MEKKYKLYLFLIVILIGFESIAQTKEYPYVDEVGFVVRKGQKAPDFKIEFADGRQASVLLSELKGNVVLLQFTASWCSVCRKEMPHLEKRIWQVFKDQKFYLIGIDREETPDKVRKFSQIMKITYPLALDPEGKIYSLYAHPRSGVTRNVLIDKTGKIVYLTRLFEEEEFGKLIEKVKEELAR